MMTWFIRNFKDDLKIIKSLKQMKIEVTEVFGKELEFKINFKDGYGCIKSVRAVKWNKYCYCTFDGDFSYLNGKTSLLSIWLASKCDKETSKHMETMKKKKIIEDQKKHNELKNKALRNY